MSHTPVLLNEVLKYLDPKPGSFIIDGTVNGGGHAEAIIRRIAPGGMFLGIDWDQQILRKTEAKFGHVPDVSVLFQNGNYADVQNVLRDRKLPKADGLLLDLGFSSEQLEESGKGFAFMKDEDLRMTYAENEPPVKKILKELSERDLAKILFAYSGEKFAMRIARAIKAREKKKAIETSGELSELIKQNVPTGYERGRIHPATRTFQALRIYANRELENIRSILGKVADILKPQGRIVIISFHSLEDKIVKQEFRELAKKEMLEILTKKPIRANEEEIARNPRSRSAKLRAAKIVNSS